MAGRWLGAGDGVCICVCLYVLGGQGRCMRCAGTEVCLCYTPHRTPFPPLSINARRQLFEEGQWVALRELFLKELYRLQSLPPESMLTVHLQVGCAVLAAISPSCMHFPTLCS